MWAASWHCEGSTTDTRRKSLEKNLVSQEKTEMIKEWALFHVEYGEPILKEKSLIPFSLID